MVLTGQSSKHLWALVNSVGFVPIAHPEPKRAATKRAFRFSAEQRAAVIESYEANATMADLARQYGVGRQAISGVLRKAGVEIRKPPVISQAEIDQAVRLYEQGLSLQRIGARLGWDHQTIYRHLKKRGVSFRDPSDWKYPASKNAGALTTASDPARPNP